MNGVMFIDVGSGAMEIEFEDAIRIYAQACRAWYGSAALAKVLAVVRLMESKGDQQGVHAWLQVAMELESDAVRSPPERIEMPEDQSG